MLGLTVLVGAGASQALEGMPGTKEISEWIRDTDQEFYSLLEKEISLEGIQHITFEHLFHAMEMVHSYLDFETNTNKKNSPAWTWIVNGIKPSFKKVKLGYNFFWLLKKKFFTTLFSRLHEKTLRLQTNYLESYKNLWVLLENNFTTTVATLNYDDCIEKATGQLFTDGYTKHMNGIYWFESQKFSDSKQSRLMHLHGSIRSLQSKKYSAQDFGKLVREVGNLCEHGGELKSQAGEKLAIPLITGLNKSDKILQIEPFLTYYQTFSNSLRQNPRLLIIGYGFQDYYINSLLCQLSNWHTTNLKVVCIDFGEPIKEKRGFPKFFRSDEAYKTWNGMVTIDKDFTELLKYAREPYENFTTSTEFFRSQHIALYLNGLNSILSSKPLLQDIINFLGGEKLSPIKIDILCKDENSRTTSHRTIFS